MYGMLLTVVGSLVAAWVVQQACHVLYNLFLHPLAKFPGPRAAATGWYKTVREVFQNENWIDVLKELHAEYGDVVRVGPNELHFSRPEAYHELYNHQNRWDKEERLYHSFGEDRSSFGFLTYREAKQRRDVLAPLFSKRAISELQGLAKKSIDRLCIALATENAHGKSSDMLFALRCFSLDTIVTYCFAQDLHSTAVPDFQAPTVVAMDASLPAFVIFKHFDLVRRMVFGMPGWLTKLTNPALSGLVDLQTLLGSQIDEIVSNPETLQKTSHPTIYNRLMDPDVNKATGVPPPGSLYEEAQALFFAGAESAGNTAMLGIYHILQDESILARLKAELRTAWPDVANPPRVEELEKLPYVTAIIKESLRISPGVPAPLPRIVPATGATVSGRLIPGGTIVGMSPIFVHESSEVFDQPHTFNPERWLGSKSAALERWLVAFSRGPRSCLGQTLGMCELYLAFAVLFRRFDIQLDATKPEDLSWRECFLPAFNTKHMRAFCKPLTS